MRKEIKEENVVLEKTNNNDFKKKETWLQKWFSPLRSKKPRSDNKFFGFLQRLGGTFMLPIAVMAVAGVLMGVGSGIGGLLTNGSGGWYFFDFLTKTGGFFFDLMPLSFAIAIPVGLVSNNQGSAALAAVFAYFGTLTGMSFTVNLIDKVNPDLYGILFNPNGIFPDPNDHGFLTTIVGISQVMDMSVVGAIVIGLVIWKMTEKLQYRKLPTVLAFISAKRLTPTLAIIIFPIWGLVVTFIWPWFGLGLFYIGKGLYALGDWGPGIYAFMQRLLCPTGLHHMTSSLLGYTTVGGHWEVFDAAGNLIEAADGTTMGWKLFSAHGQLVPHDLARWLSGANSVYMFWSLPAAAIAMFVCAKKDQRPMIKGTIISIIATSIFGGITEPIEFLFLFVAPWLYVFHAFMTGTSFVVFALLDVRIGYGGDIWGWFTWGPIWGLQTNWWKGLIVSPIYSVIYFLVFYFSIKKFDIKTIGRGETDGKADAAVANVLGTNDLKDPLKKSQKKKETQEHLIAKGCLDLLGGWENIESLNNCYSRLRITLKEPREITDAQVKALGAMGVKKISNKAYQIIIGVQVEIVRHEMEVLKEVSY